MQSSERLRVCVDPKANRRFDDVLGESEYVVCVCDRCPEQIDFQNLSQI